MSSKRPTRRKRTANNWKSSMLGTHASTSSHGAHSWGKRGASARTPQRKKSSFSHRPVADHRAAAARGGYESRRHAVSLEGRTAELNQMRPAAASAMDMSSMRRRPSDPAALIRRRRRNFFLAIGAVVVLVVVLAFALGGFVFQSVISGNMSLKDSSVKSALVEPENADDPYYVMLTGTSNNGTEASYIAVLRVDKTNNKLTLLNIPSNIASGNGQLRDLPGTSDMGSLVGEVSTLLGVDIAHYVSLTDEGLVSLVDSIGGIDVNVEKLVDDPRAGTSVLEPGQQTLNGKQALTYVRAYNYEDGRTVRATVQYQVLQAIIQKVSSLDGMDFMKAADALSNGIQTDFSYDDLSDMSEFYSGATLLYGTVPGSTYESDKRTFFRVATTGWEKVKSSFVAGEEPSVDYKVSKSEKKSLSIIVLNGSGVSGNAQKVQEKLEENGYKVKETGNAEAFVYEETLIVYRSSKNEKEAQALAETLGVGRAVAAGVNYNLSTDIQIMVGKDWVS